jgi:hypothetical protein
MPKSGSRSEFEKVSRLTQKYENYFSIYDLALLSAESPLTVVEIGVANGGSMQMWRQLLGPKARIIGIDLNPSIESLVAEGFEVLIADMGFDESWERLSQLTGGPESIDVLIDDGGHTNAQQIKALVRGLPMVTPGGFIVIEDLHASFMRKFGNPSRFSTWEFLVEILGDVQRDHGKSDMPVRYPKLTGQIDRMTFGTSIVAIQKRNAHDFSSQSVTAGTDDSLDDYDHRWDSISEGFLFRTLSTLSAWSRHVLKAHFLVVAFYSRREFLRGLRESRILNR